MRRRATIIEWIENGKYHHCKSGYFKCTTLNRDRYFFDEDLDIIITRYHCGGCLNTIIEKVTLFTNWNDYSLYSSLQYTL